MRALLALLLFGFSAGAQAPAPQPLASQNPGSVYICPMDPDVRSNSPGKCARCGMALVAGLPDPVEYHMHVDVTPRPIKIGQLSNLRRWVRTEASITNTRFPRRECIAFWAISIRTEQRLS